MHAGVKRFCVELRIMYFGRLENDCKLFSNTDVNAL